MEAWRKELYHGWSWKKHKYVTKINGRYIYPGDKKDLGWKYNKNNTYALARNKQRERDHANKENNPRKYVFESLELRNNTQRKDAFRNRPGITERKIRQYVNEQRKADHKSSPNNPVNKSESRKNRVENFISNLLTSKNAIIGSQSAVDKYIGKEKRVQNATDNILTITGLHSNAIISGQSVVDKYIGKEKRLEKVTNRMLTISGLYSNAIMNGQSIVNQYLKK